MELVSIGTVHLVLKRHNEHYVPCWLPKHVKFLAYPKQMV